MSIAPGCFALGTYKEAEIKEFWYVSKILLFF